MKRLALIAFLAAGGALAWWTPNPDGTPVWLLTDPGSPNDHGFLTQQTLNLLQSRGSPAAAELLAQRERFLYGVWAEDFPTGTAGDPLYAIAHYWDSGNGAPVFAEKWFEAAVTARQLGQRDLAAEYLGRALHYVQDVTHPFHAWAPSEPAFSGVGCFHQPFYGVTDWRSHCHSVVEVRVAASNTSIASVPVPTFLKSKQPGSAATAWARQVHGKSDREVLAAITRWHDSVRSGSFAYSDQLVPALRGRAVAGGAGLVEAWYALSR